MRYKRGVLLVWIGVGVGLSLMVRAQEGDKAGEVQRERVPKEKIPPSPPLNPAEAVKAFQVASGFRVEVVAAEPLVEAPVAMAFDALGRIWVVEMPGFMPNLEGTGETNIPGRVVILEDADGDGRADRRKIFLDHLNLPRGLAMAGNGILLAEPPHLWYCRDVNGDDVCDEKTKVAGDYGTRMNPEHTANGLVRALDNWYYNLYHPWRYRLKHGVWERSPVPNRVQWGLAQDDFGRLFFTSNSDSLRADLLPSHYAGTQATVRLPGMNVQIARDQTVWPARVNPGVNRGYQEGTLREDGTLLKFVAACGTCIYRGDLFPPDYRGNAFVCEPAGNFVRRFRLEESDGQMLAVNAHERSEFLASLDERFRPVNVLTGPEGALYVVDMYRGLIQHRLYLTTYLKNQILQRRLLEPLNYGRIYRLFPANAKPAPPPALVKASPNAWVHALSHPNGWVRDTAQRLLVEQARENVPRELQSLAQTATNPLTRLHALWALEGLGPLNEAIVAAALDDGEPRVRAQAVRLAEGLVTTAASGETTQPIKSRLVARSEDPSMTVQSQVALSLGVLAFGPETRQALEAMQQPQRQSQVKALAAYSLERQQPRNPTDSPPVARVKPVTAEHQAQIKRGREVFEITCIACHQAHGLGQEGLAPPLAGAVEWVGGPPERLARIVLHGMRGPIKVKGQDFELDMPALAVLDDQQIADVLTYVRREWGHTFDAISPDLVKKVRAATAERLDAWTVAELMKVP